MQSLLWDIIRDYDGESEWKVMMDCIRSYTYICFYHLDMECEKQNQACAMVSRTIALDLGRLASDGLNR